MTENPPNRMLDTIPQIQGPQRTASRIYPNKTKQKQKPKTNKQKKLHIGLSFQIIENQG